MGKLRMIGGTFVALILTTAGIVALSGPAQASKGFCKSVTIELPARPDSGVKGNDWAVNKLTRTTNVCVVVADDQAWQYKATVKDQGTFKTVAGDSPAGTVTLKGGTEGTVTGGFEATFTANTGWDGWNPGALNAKTSTSEWIATAFLGAEFNDAGPVAAWSWTYTTKCESWTNAEAGNVGDITEKVCPTPTATPTTAPTATPSTAPGNGSTGGSGGNSGLPVTGVNIGAVVGAGLLLLGVGGVLLLMRRRRATFEA